MNRMDAMLREIEKTKNPKIQLKNIMNRLQEIQNIQKHQQAQVSLEMDECTKVSNISSPPLTSTEGMEVSKI